MAELVCPVCQSLNPEDAQSCRNCGESLLGSHHLNNSQIDPIDASGVSLAQTQPSLLDDLEGVLPIETPLIYYRPPVLLDKVQISDSQQNYIGLLEKLINSTDAGNPELPPSGGVPLRWQKLILALVLAASLLTAMVFFKGKEIEVDLPPELIAVTRWIDDLPPGAPVLVAIDYPASAIGEMELTASPVIEHLMDRESYLVLVSTQPTGPLQAERLIKQVSANRQRQSGNLPYSQFVNLGFIPGGASGLAGFAISPAKFAEYPLSPIEADQPDPWANPPLSGVSSLDSFAMIIVITESPDTARNWIEQIQPELNWTPFIMVLSVQADPVIRSYYENNSTIIQGMVVGIAGGTGYEELTGIQAGTSQKWPLYVAGIWILGISLVITAGVNLLSAWAVQGEHGMNKGSEK